MRIFKVFLLSFILIAPVKANTIYNLIKIPNLEIYELKTPNNLKNYIRPIFEPKGPETMAPFWLAKSPNLTKSEVKA